MDERLYLCCMKMKGNFLIALIEILKYRSLHAHAGSPACGRRFSGSPSPPAVSLSLTPLLSSLLLWTNFTHGVLDTLVFVQEHLDSFGQLSRELLCKSSVCSSYDRSTPLNASCQPCSCFLEFSSVFETFCKPIFCSFLRSCS